MVELLISKGAYYIFGDIVNNLEVKLGQTNEEQSRYYILETKK
jgi:hypothetical protein